MPIPILVAKYAFPKASRVAFEVPAKVLLLLYCSEPIEPVPVPPGVTAVIHGDPEAKFVKQDEMTLPENVDEPIYVSESGPFKPKLPVMVPYVLVPYA